MTYSRTIDEAPRVPFNLDGRILFSERKMEIVHLCLKPGEKVERHAQPFDVLFFVIEGNGILEVDDETMVTGKDTLVEVKEGCMRGWLNSGRSDLRLFVIKLMQ
jgi:mannose-6-phosphate isomerase-like protein (cupin superfamily)